MSELLTKKIRIYLKRFDISGKGHVSKKDMVELAEQYCDVEKVTATTREEIKKAFIDVWRIWNKSAGTGDDGLVTPSILLESIKQQRNDPEFKAKYAKVLRLFFSVMDKNGDGYLQEDECAKSYTLMGVPDVSFVHHAFNCMDVNKDGKISLEEFITAIIEYITSEDKSSRYTLLLGPLD